MFFAIFGPFYAIHRPRDHQKWTRRTKFCMESGPKICFAVIKQHFVTIFMFFSVWIQLHIFHPIINILCTFFHISQRKDKTFTLLKEKVGSFIFFVLYIKIKFGFQQHNFYPFSQNSNCNVFFMPQTPQLLSFFIMGS